MLGAGGSQHRAALPVEQDDRANVDVELHVDMFGLVVVGSRGDADAGVVDQHVETTEALSVASDNLRDRGFVGHVRRDVFDLIAVGPECCCRLFEWFVPPGRDRQSVALCGECLG